MNTVRKKKKSASDQFTNQVLKDVNQIRSETSVTKSFDLLRNLETQVKGEVSKAQKIGEQVEAEPTTIAGSAEADEMWGNLVVPGETKNKPEAQSAGHNSKSNGTVTEMDFSNLRRGRKGKGSERSGVNEKPKSPPPTEYREGFGDPTELFGNEEKAFNPEPLETVQRPFDEIAEYPQNDEATEMINTANEISSTQSENMWLNSSSVAMDYNPPSVNFQSQDVNGEDKTIAISSTPDFPPMPQGGMGNDDRTIAVPGIASRKNEDNPKTTVGYGQVNYGYRTGGSVYTSGDASLIQAENLKIAQTHIQDLESEVDKLRKENEELASAGEVIQKRCDELLSRTNELERQKNLIDEQHRAEQVVLKDNLAYKEQHVKELQQKVEELDHRLKQDFRKIRVRERELENRLEIAKQERNALAKAKDDVILELKRKLDLLQIEVDGYREKTLDLNKQINSNEEQFKRTVRALRLALTNLEVSDEGKVLKKAE